MKTRLHFIVVWCFVLMTSSLSAQQSIREADERFDVGDYDAAISFYKTLIRAYKIHGLSVSDIEKRVALAKQCQSLLSTGNDYYGGYYYATAIECYKVLKDLNPNDPNVDEKIRLCELGVESIVPKSLPSRRVVYSGVAEMDDGNSVKIKRIEIDFETSKGSCYYSDTPLNLEIVNLSRTGTGVKLIIQETYPQMTRRSVLGDKISSIFKGVYNFDGSITGRGTNWRGRQFTFKFSPENVVVQEGVPYQVTSKVFTMYVGDLITAKLSEGEITKWEIFNESIDYANVEGKVLRAKKAGNIKAWGYVGGSPKLFQITIITK